RWAVPDAAWAGPIGSKPRAAAPAAPAARTRKLRRVAMNFPLVIVIAGPLSLQARVGIGAHLGRSLTHERFTENTVLCWKVPAGEPGGQNSLSSVGTRISRLPAWFAGPTMPSFSIFSM